MTRIWSRPLGGIRFGDFVFSEPVPLHRLFLPANSVGIYAVLTPDPTWGPRHFQPLFFGEFTSGRQFSITETELLWWYRAAAGKGVFIAILIGPPLYADHLADVKRRLILEYQPICNQDHDTATAVGQARRLEALERKTYEQDVVLKLALAALGHVIQPLVETKKRPVGFVHSS